MFLAGHPSQECFGLQSHCAPCYFFNQASFYPSDFSFIWKLHIRRSSRDVCRQVALWEELKILSDDTVTEIQAAAGVKNNEGSEDCYETDKLQKEPTCSKFLEYRKGCGKTAKFAKLPESTVNEILRIMEIDLAPGHFFRREQNLMRLAKMFANYKH
ncbi:hypothetical protein TNCV_4686581 [Trichonephila clavipes]|nr:hypothetical protein TNCV_4686581 [Trichonephila clavipes]